MGCMGRSYLLSLHTKTKAGGITIREIKLLRCPFCGSKFVPDFEEDAYHNFRVVCRLKVGGCGASTALSARLIDAVKAWNRRTKTTTDYEYKVYFEE